MADIRLDVAVHAKTPSLSRSFAKKLIKEGKVTVNDESITRVSQKIKADDKIKVDYAAEEIPEIELPIIYEDADCLVINKPEGLLTHSKGKFNPEPTVATWLSPQTRDFENTDRGGIVHRLDRATSGVMICAKHQKSQEWLQKQFASRKAVKTYFALIEGAIEPDKAVIDVPIERNPKSPQRFRAYHTGKKAQTSYKVIQHFSYDGHNFSLVELSPKTGRTHQLRVHLAFIKKPIVGDNFYGGSSADRLYLHAATLELTLPNNQKKVFDSPIPSNFMRPRLNG